MGNVLYLHRKKRGVAQPGLEYASGGRVVASSNLVTPTEQSGWKSRISRRFCYYSLCISFKSFIAGVKKRRSLEKGLKFRVFHI